jgi:hypothetical protein
VTEWFCAAAAVCRCRLPLPMLLPKVTAGPGSWCPAHDIMLLHWLLAQAWKSENDSCKVLLMQQAN